MSYMKQRRTALEPGEANRKKKKKKKKTEGGGGLNQFYWPETAPLTLLKL